MNTPWAEHRRRLPAETVLHLKLFNPLDDYYGMSPLEAARAAIDTHNAASAWNKAHARQCGAAFRRVGLRGER